MTSSITSTSGPATASGPRWRKPHRALALRQADRAQALLERADIRLGGHRPWDLQVHHPDTLRQILKGGSLALGETYVQGWWDCAQIDAFICRALRAGLHHQVACPGRLRAALRARLLNLQSMARSWQVARVHYDLGNDLYEAMLDPSMAYSCGYWAQASTLEQAQQAKLDLVCRKLELRPGMRLLDIGCGWGSLMRHAAEHYGVECVGLTVSNAQAEWGQARHRGLPIRFELGDYRRFNPDAAQSFDAVASVGMFEHVGHKNYRTFFDMARRCLRPDGLFLLHTIGKNRSSESTDPWIEKYIFPNGELPSAARLSASSEHAFVIEDWHNFGADYDRTLMAWQARFEQAWPTLRARYGERFYRLWRYYLLSCAGTFRARDNQLWQVVMSPNGATGGYRRPLA
jgi:cyclopropane-fatty-acyl-phospholipid synthase